MLKSEWEINSLQAKLLGTTMAVFAVLMESCNKHFKFIGKAAIQMGKIRKSHQKKTQSHKQQK